MCLKLPFANLSSCQILCPSYLKIIYGRDKYSFPAPLLFYMHLLLDHTDPIIMVIIITMFFIY